MRMRLLALILTAVPLTASAGGPSGPTKVLDVSGVSAIRIVGAASAISLTTAEDAPLEATLGGRRSGWFAKWYSSWFYNDCRTASRMHIEDTTLTVEVGPSSWLDPSDCRVEFVANARKGVSVTVEQAASQVRLAGEFSTLSLDAEAADLTPDGHATTVRLDSKALRSHLTFERSEGDETITIAGHSLDTYVGFAPGTAISYDVDASAAMVDSSLPNTAGARPSIAIEGEYVRAVIR